MTSTSLRLRLTLIILVPILAIGVVVGAWQVSVARATAAEIFDRSLLSAALAISGDIARTDGNAITLETSDILSDTSGGPVFYHVFAPDGIYVLGYATPPVPPLEVRSSDGEISYYDGRYQRSDVRVLRYRAILTVDGISGPFTFTVWQDVAVRSAFVRDLVLRTFSVIAVLIGSLALVVWFGVSVGLRPLLDLEDAISRRSSDDLSPIRRAVPPETRGLVTRLNTLFGQVEQAMETQTTLISNAAHQLRNPIAGVLAMAEAVQSAPSDTDMRSRVSGLLSAARRASDLANKLLTLERIRAAPPETLTSEVDVKEIVRDTVAMLRQVADEKSIHLSMDVPAEPVKIIADPVLLGEAFTNVIDNALQHGGAPLKIITVSLEEIDGFAVVTIKDDGVGLAANEVQTVLARFGQTTPGEGSGLGLSIAEAVAQRHGGRLDIATEQQGLIVSIHLPLKP